MNSWIIIELEDHQKEIHTNDLVLNMITFQKDRKKCLLPKIDILRDKEGTWKLEQEGSEEYISIDAPDNSIFQGRYHIELPDNTNKQTLTLSSQRLVLKCKNAHPWH